MAKRIQWPPPRLTASVWKAMPIAERAEMVAGLDTMTLAVVQYLDAAGLVVEETAPDVYTVRPR